MLKFFARLRPPVAGFITAVILVCACATGGTGPTPTTPGGKFKACSSDALVTASQGILPAVANAIATADFEGELAILAAKYTAAEVICAVALLRDELTRKASADRMAATELTHANTYLAKRQAE